MKKNEEVLTLGLRVLLAFIVVMWVLLMFKSCSHPSGRMPSTFLVVSAINSRPVVTQPLAVFICANHQNML